jgi:hypothetical protein
MTYHAGVVVPHPECQVCALVDVANINSVNVAKKLFSKTEIPENDSIS